MTESQRGESNPGHTPVSSPWVTESLPEDELRRAVRIANIPVLLMVVFQVSGDEKWLEHPFAPSRGKGLADHDDGGLPEPIQEEIREAAVRAILSLQEGAEPAIPLPSPQLTQRMMSVCMGETVGEEYGEMMSSEIARRIEPKRIGIELDPDPVEPPPGFKALVIGTGVAGIVAAYELEQMGVGYEIVSKYPEPGGVWWANTYPGAGVDTPSYLYSFHFAKNDWGMHFELQEELQRYLARVIGEIVDPAQVRHETEVLRADWDEAAKLWTLELRGPDGALETVSANVVISGVGSINQAQLPDIPGVEEFEGVHVHSSAWPPDLDLRGKRVALVGTGASSMQIGPAIAEQVEHLTVFQRSPAWIAPFEKFGKPIPIELSDLLRACPLYHAWYWARLFWQFGDKVIDALRIDPDWAFPDRSVNARNDGHREFFTRYLTEQLAGRPDLIEKTLPTYPPYGKRILLDNGWFEMLRREDVTLVDEAVVQVEGNEVVTEGGGRYEADVIIWGTGFDTSRFVASLEVHGIGGVSLREAWDDDDPRAFLGLTTPGFPNFFMLGGPSSFPGSGSFIFFMEVQMRYVRRLLTTMFERGITAIAPTRAANDAYNRRVDEMHAETVWTHPGMSTYYRNSKGRVVFVMPFLNVEYWEMTKQVDPESYEAV